jgi:hypothetical protein
MQIGGHNKPEAVVVGEVVDVDVVVDDALED